MSTTSLQRKLNAEFVGTLFLVATVVGSGIIAEDLAGTNVALASSRTTIATGAILLALIFAFGGISGAHFDPAVTVADVLEHGSLERDYPPGHQASEHLRNRAGPRKGFGFRVSQGRHSEEHT